MQAVYRPLERLAQRERTTRRRAKGHDTTAAEKLLEQYEQLHAIFEIDLQQLTE